MATPAALSLFFSFLSCTPSPPSLSLFPSFFSSTPHLSLSVSTPWLSLSLCLLSHSCQCLQKQIQPAYFTFFLFLLYVHYLFFLFFFFSSLSLLFFLITTSTCSPLLYSHCPCRRLCYQSSSNILLTPHSNSHPITDHKQAQPRLPNP